MRGSRRSLVLAAAIAGCGALLGLVTNVASSLVSDAWASDHATWVWAATAVLAFACVGLAVAAARDDGRDDGRNDGASIMFISVAPSPAPQQREGQIVAGELPGAPPAFVARQSVERLSAVFEAGARVAAVSALTGGRGTGKSQVAAAYARRSIEAGVPVVAWISAEDRALMLADLAGVARRLGVEDPNGDSERSARNLRDLFAVRAEAAVLVFDNAVDPAHIRPYLPASGAVRVIITSTDRAFTSMGEDVAVDVFDREESVGYLTRRTGSDQGADALADELGDLPLALAQAASAIRRRNLSYAEYLERFRRVPLDEMLPADRGDRYPHGVAQAIFLSVDAVRDKVTARVLIAASLLAPGGVSRAVLSRLVGRRRLDAALGRLVEASLLVWAKDRDVVVMHGLVARAIRDRLEKEGDLGSAISDAADALAPLLVSTADAWARRGATEELVGHAVVLWEHTTSAAARGAIKRKDVEVIWNLPSWALRHLTVTADLSRAIELGMSLLPDADRLFGPDHRETIACRNNLASAYQSSGDLPRAVSLFEESVSASERVLGADHPDTLGLLSNLGGAYQAAGDLGRAIAVHEDASARREHVFGPDHPESLNSRNNLAQAYADAGDLVRAIPLLEATLAGRERVLGVDHPNTLTSRNNLANAYQASGDLARAIPLHEEASAACERVLGPDHPYTLVSRNNLAHAYQANGDLTRAMGLQRATHAECDRILGSDHPITLTAHHNVAHGYEAAGDLTRAISLYEDLLPAFTRVLGPEHPDALRVNGSLARAHAAAGDRDRAVALYVSTLAACERVLGPDHPITKDVRSGVEGLR